MTHPVPGRPAPALETGLLGGGTWRLHEQKPRNFTMIVFYRGLHCPICSRYLKDLHARLDRFAALGVEAVAISSDTPERAARAAESWQVAGLAIGHSLDLATARAWGLYVSAGRGKTSVGIEEPARFNEPGLFLVRPDGTLYWASMQSMPFGRPSFEDLAGSIEFVLARDYPARGELA